MEFHPVTPERWQDLVQLFANNEDPGDCWCMTWRLPGNEYRRMASAGRKRELEGLVQNGTPVGILGYLEGEPVGWCSIAPRETYTRLEHSATIRRIDDQVTWSVVCFFVDPKARGQGTMVQLLQAAVEYARSQGAKVVEGYPVEPPLDESGNLQPASSSNFMGSVSAFRKAGFREVEILNKGRHIMRYSVNT